MGLSSEIVSQFVKITKDANNETPSETTVHGTTVNYNGRMYVKLDGSELLTPVKSTASVSEGDKVTVVISKHNATITGNMSDPSASSKVVKEQGSKINEFEIIMAYKVTTDDLEAVNAAIENLKATAARLEDATIVNAEIESLEAKFANLEHVNAKDIEAITANIESIHAKFGEYENITTEDLEAVNAEIDNLKAYTANFTYVSADVLNAMKANIKMLESEKLSAEDAKIKYAQIDFANIGEVAIKKIFTDSGIIKDLVMSDGFVTGELVGVTIKGDLIKGNTIVADKLVIKGEDGIYYKLNTEGGATVSEAITEEQLQNGLSGSVIIANTITAEKINVDDLVAFGATIAGFNLVGKDLEKNTPGKIYSGAKASVDNSTEGIYLDDSGQMNVGNTDNFIKFFKDEETGEYILRISADSIVFGGTGRDVESDLINISQDVENNQNLTNSSALRIEDLRQLLYKVVTDDAGNSLMIITKESYVLTDEILTDITDGELLNGVTTTTGEAIYRVINSDSSEVCYSIIDSVYYKVIHNPETCTFNISDIQNSINASNKELGEVSAKLDGVDSTVTDMLKTVTDLALLGGYIIIDEEMEVKNDDGTTETVPAIILGKNSGEGSEFKVIITNKQIAFCEGFSTPAYISGQTLIAQKVEIENELSQTAPDKSGRFVWKVRSNGNYGLTWEGGVS